MGVPGGAVRRYGLPVTRRVVIALCNPVHWTPPGVERRRWRAALAEDVVDLLAMLHEVQPAVGAVAADRPMVDDLVWPGMPIYELPEPTVGAALDAAAADGYDQAAVIAADAPDVPGLILAKLLRPLTTRSVAVAPNSGSGGGLFGVAAQLPAPDWLPPIDIDTADAATLRRAAPRPAAVAVTPAWRRLRGPADLGTLDPAVEGWEATRALLGG